MLEKNIDQDIIIKYGKSPYNKIKIENIKITTNENLIIQNENIKFSIGYWFYLFSGQLPVPISANKSVASFKLRKGMTCGLKTSISGKKNIKRVLDNIRYIIMPQYSLLNRHNNNNKNISKHYKGYNIGIEDIYINTFESKYQIKDKELGGTFALSNTMKKGPGINILIKIKGAHKLEEYKYYIRALLLP